MFADHFSIANIPFGVASGPSHPQKTLATRLEDTVIFLDELINHGLLSPLTEGTLQAMKQPNINAFAALPKTEHRAVRSLLQRILSQSSLPLSCTASIHDVKLHLPVSIGDFTDFSCSKDHLLNAGEAIMRDRRLPPGFLHFPIGYTGRTSSIVVSGTDIKRPKGQFRASGKVVFEPTRQLDYELEVGCVIGKPSKLGEGVNLKDADEHIFGLVLLNDWSARDIQALEMPPLGPLNGKSFGTSISPWIITLDALSPSETTAPPREFPAATYLQEPKQCSTYTIDLTAEILAEGHPTTICKSNLQSMCWTFRDLVAHQTVNGCNINTGDLLGTGTISGTTDDSHGCLMELTRGGEEAFPLTGGGERVYLQDGDVIRISAWACPGVGFGDCVGRISPASAL